MDLINLILIVAAAIIVLVVFLYARVLNTKYESRICFTPEYLTVSKGKLDCLIPHTNKYVWCKATYYKLTIKNLTMNYNLTCNDSDLAPPFNYTPFQYNKSANVI
jgi:hypothetical protein